MSTIIPRIFILDDQRSIIQAMTDAGLDLQMLASYSIARNLDDAFDIIHRSQVFDLAVLDNDLGVNRYGKQEEGYDFLKRWIDDEGGKSVPVKVVSCSGNPTRRHDILALFKNWEANGRQPMTPIGAEGQK